MNRKALHVAAVTAMMFGLVGIIYYSLSAGNVPGSSIVAAVFAGAVIGGAAFLVVSRRLMRLLRPDSAFSGQRGFIILASSLSTVPVAIVGSLAGLWRRPFPTALGYGLIIGAVYILLFWCVMKLITLRKRLT